MGSTVDSQHWRSSQPRYPRDPGNSCLERRSALDTAILPLTLTSLRCSGALGWKEAKPRGRHSRTEGVSVAPRRYVGSTLQMTPNAGCVAVLCRNSVDGNPLGNRGLDRASRVDTHAYYGMAPLS